VLCAEGHKDEALQALHLAEIACRARPEKLAIVEREEIEEMRAALLTPG
jgi:hypothetical protein